MAKKIKIIALVLSFFALFTAANFALAADFGVNEVNTGLAGSLSSADPRVIIGRIIQIALGFLGVIAVALCMYAGFLWMSSGGDEEKITKAKTILRNAVIGLVIIMSSWGIATYILSRLAEATGAGGGSEIPASTTSGFSNPGVAAIGACSIDSTYPASGQGDLPRNTAIIVSFKEELKLDSVCMNDAGETCGCNKTDCNNLNPLAVRLYKTELGDACSASSCPNPNGNVTGILVSVAAGDKTLILTPADFLGSSDGNTSYAIKFTDAVKKKDGSSMFASCAANYANWEFTVSNTIDLTPPVVALSGEAPLPDNDKDTAQAIVPAVAALAAITVDGAPVTYAPAAVVSVVAAGSSPAATEAQVALDYHGALSEFTVVVPAGSPEKAQLFSGSDLLGAANFSDTGAVNFENYFSFKPSSHTEGNSWTINISPEKLADTIAINSTTYTFVPASTTPNAQEIVVPSAYSNNAQAASIAAKVSGNEDVYVAFQNNSVGLKAKVAGASGNDISLISSSKKLSLIPFSGGVDRRDASETKGQKDRPMNSVIQMNFSKPVNPLTVSGSASEVAAYLKVVNAESAAAAGTNCTENYQCASYKCENSVCVGDYLNGHFLVSNNYRTVEFISDRECGVNGCGEKIYCLPANSHLSVKIKAANLKSCTADTDCAAFNPFKTCSSTPLGYKTCQDDKGNNYPTANIDGLDGVVDASLNSLDGNRSEFADGPIDYYDSNASDNTGKKDSYTWSFYVSNQMMTTPPQITAVKPASGQAGGQSGLADPVEIHFNALMMNSTLRTGSVSVQNGTSIIEHKLINLSSSAPSALGYWISSVNEDTEPRDGEPDLTTTYISHSPFAESMTFKAQVGSGVKDIYQNCYKPSIGPGCLATAENPSCCFGAATNALGTDGNCQ